jgi:3,4-dihydroxy 2-butanone 4-phosphate synthase / GTP cyclohydrolase II
LSEIELISSADLPSQYSDCMLRIHAFRNISDGVEHIAIAKEPLSNQPLVRLHSECLTGDALGSLRCDCGDQLREAIRLISLSDGGVVVYLRNQEGRGIGLGNKVRAYSLQDRGRDTVEANTELGFQADARSYEAGFSILKHFGISSLILLSNNGRKARALRERGLKVEERPLVVETNPHSLRYLQTKQLKLGHTIFGDKR